MADHSLPTTSAPEIERVMARRAAKYAERQGRGATLVQETRLLLLIKVAEQLIGLPAQEVSEIIRLDHYAPVPHAAPNLLGVVNVQNDLYSLLDAANLVHAGAPGATHAQAIVLRHPELRLALACTEVIGLEHVTLDKIQADGIFQSGSTFGTLLEIESIIAALEHPLS
jgi:chemotaxis signal transduction protein